MTTAEAIVAFVALNPNQRLRLLALFGHNLTIAARELMRSKRLVFLIRSYYAL